MEINPIYDETFLTKRNNLNYNSILSRWFYVPFGSPYLAIKPKLLPFPGGFNQKGTLISTVLSTRDEYEMWTTDADAILANFYFNPGNRTLKRILSIPGKPIIISVDFGILANYCILKLAKKLNSFGAAGLYLKRDVSARLLKIISSECSLPLFASSSADFGEIKSKIRSGAYGVCISGINISSEITAFLHQEFPYNPVVAICNKSETLMRNSVKSGCDAFIFSSCVPFV